MNQDSITFEDALCKITLSPVAYGASEYVKIRIEQALHAPESEIVEFELYKDNALELVERLTAFINAED